MPPVKNLTHTPDEFPDVRLHRRNSIDPWNATRSYAYSLYVDSDEASVLNAFLAIEIQKNPPCSHPYKIPNQGFFLPLD
jgi:hypothetical protein